MPIRSTAIWNFCKDDSKMKIGDKQCPQQKKMYSPLKRGKIWIKGWLDDAPASGPTYMILFPLQRRDIHLGFDVYSFQYTEKVASCLLYYSALRIKPDMFNISHCKALFWEEVCLSEELDSVRNSLTQPCYGCEWLDASTTTKVVKWKSKAFCV